MEPKNDIEIAQSAILANISELASNLHLNENDWEPYGKYIAKLNTESSSNKQGNLILVTAINPTPAGEGKTTVTIGLGQALNRINKNAVVTLREPSLGPTLGMKGGATGGGYSQVLPMEDINLHFTGDIHAITTANNALAALLDNHIHHGNELNIDPRRVIINRVVDLNDRSLRNVTIGLGGPFNGIPREDKFDITVASEIMAILCLATSLEDLKDRLSKMVIAYNYQKEPITVRDLNVEGALTVLLKKALHPNLVQTIENTPAIVHGGPFANIAHGCCSLIATKTALGLSDYVITEAGFGADLGAEKFFNLKCRIGELKPRAVVIVATTRALKMHGGVGKTELLEEDITAVEKGIENLEKHIQTIQTFGLPVIVAINRFATDSKAELEYIIKWCEKKEVDVSLTEVWEHGGKGGIDLAEKVVNICEEKESDFSFLYSNDETIEEKVASIAKKVYGAKDVVFSKKARNQINLFQQYKWDKLPVCIAKTQYSLSDDPSLLGRPKDFSITINELKPSIGAGFIVALAGNILTMPGLPKNPAALNIDIDDNGNTKGLF
ncbi:formate--tetrahydrofolate ligase [Lottiidibacillus patelloidae]|uniref:Formate--tetrahydrofolate ligase n=1 Tax=Lottiidibacillus patelloidae TaxID=2670334 RepID=A0A263BUR9_9BACI|nr:formate--tetrahydrofolate ligase [Lottiidibacillus patelloidae]OZM57435.1 formate--tetrahydrofolate ligase [Lottiidibacillus patelloidae]